MDAWDATVMVIIAIGSFINALNIRQVSRRLDRTITRQANALDREAELTGIVKDVVKREIEAARRDLRQR